MSFHGGRKNGSYKYYNIYKNYMTTTIAVKEETKDMLKSLGNKGETYDDIIRTLAIAYDEFLERQYRKLEEKHNFRKMVF